MICVSLAESNLRDCLEALKGIDLAEIRLDAMDIEPAGVKRLFSSHPRLIATCRPGKFDDKGRRSLILAAVESGASMVDIEVDAEDGFKGEIILAARRRKCRVILSYHNFHKTPEKAELEHIVNWCFESGADIAKIACRVGSNRDGARLLGLLDSPRSLIVVGMGKDGLAVRLAAPLLGSPFTYAALSRGKETAEGQPDRAGLEKIYRSLDSV